MSIQVKPFLGPQPFEETDSSFFYGRDKEVQEILALILSSSISLVYAKSGLGKTSIFNAKIIPELEKGEYNFQILPVIRFTTINAIDDLREKSNYISNIYIFNTLRSIIEKSKSKNLENENILKENLEKKRLVDFLKEYKASQKEEIFNEYYIKLKILIFDQFEEFFNIYTNNRFEQQKNFFYQIKDAIDNDPALRVVFIMREEFIAYLDTFSHIFPDGFRRKFRLEPLREKSAKNAVEKPLLQALLVEPRLKGIIDKNDIERISNKIVRNLLKTHVQVYGGKTEIIIGEFVEPVQLQVVCLKLWEKDILTGKIKSQIDNIDFGDVDNALIEFYDDAVGAAKEHTKIRENKIRKWCEEKLITPAGTRSLVYQDVKYTAEMSNKVVDVLQNKYLIRAEERSGSKWFELTHDRLIKPIKDSNNLWKNSKANKAKRALLYTLVGIIFSSFLYISFYIMEDIPCSVPVTQVLEFSAGDIISIDYNPTTNKAYIANSKDNTISIIHCDKPRYSQYFNVDNNLEIEKVQLKYSPSDLSVNPTTNKVYVMHQFPFPSLSVIDGNNNYQILNKTIPLGRSPLDISIDSKFNKVYVANYGDGTVSVIDEETDQVINESIKVSGKPYSVSVNPTTNKVYVANDDSNDILVIDKTKEKDNIKTIPLLYNSVDLDINPNTNKVYASHALNNTISIIDGISDTQIKEIAVGKKPIRIDIDKETDQVFVVNQGSDSVSVIDGNTDTLLKTVKIPSDRPYDVKFIPKTNTILVSNVGSDSRGIVNVIKYDDDNYNNYITVGDTPIDIDVNPETNKTYVVNSDSDTLSIINSTNKVEKEIDVGDNPVSVGVNPLLNKIYVAHQSHSFPSLSVIDGNNNYQILQTNVTLDKDPLDIDINPITNKVYVTNYGDNSVSVIDGKTDQVMKKIIDVGKKPIRIAINTNLNKVYVTNYGDNSVSVIDGKTDQVMKKIIDVGENPFSIDVNSNTNHVYVGYSNNFHYSVIDGKKDEVLVDKNNRTVKIALIYPCPSDITMNQEKNIGYISFDCKDGIFSFSTNGTDYESKPTEAATLGLNNTNIAFNAGTNQIYVVDTESNMIYFKDIADLS
jgi:YVTN family beta-propeller protein